MIYISGTNRSKWHRIVVLYEALMMILVVISLIAMASQGDSNFKYVHRVIWFIFLIDVTVRFIKASIKWRYVKKNPFDIISVIPLEDMFLLARFSRFLKLFRYKNVIKRYLDKLDLLLVKISFVRVTLSMLLGNSIIAVILVFVTHLKLSGSFVWVFMNFFKFNYQSEIHDYIILSILLKIAGVIYMGLLLNKILTIGKSMFDRLKDKHKQKHT